LRILTAKKLENIKNYMTKFKQAPPVTLFYSTTMYNVDDKMLVENEINRYKVGTDNLEASSVSNYVFPVRFTLFF